MRRKVEEIKKERERERLCYKNEQLPILLLNFLIEKQTKNNIISVFVTKQIKHKSH